MGSIRVGNSDNRAAAPPAVSGVGVGDHPSISRSRTSKDLAPATMSACVVQEGEPEVGPKKGRVCTLYHQTEFSMEVMCTNTNTTVVARMSHGARTSKQFSI